MCLSLRMGGKVRASDAIDKAVEEEGREQKPGCDEKPGNSSARADLRTKKRRQAADLPISAKTKKAKIPE